MNPTTATVELGVSDTPAGGATANDSDALARVCARVRARLMSKMEVLPLKDIKAQACAVEAPARGFGQALKQKTGDQQIALIAEIKKASPSAGVIRADYDPVTIAHQYEAAGAACLSVLTEEDYFYGNNEDLQKVREAVSLPILRKDFILDAWQIYESRVIGADCILLIMAALEDQQAAEFLELASGLGMDVLVEVHDEVELRRALSLDASLIGVNNRNLKTLKTDIAVTEHLAPLVPPDRIIISESGIRTFEDVNRLTRIGASGFLVGESLLKQPHAGDAARALLGRA